jgi:hypothetical protein
VPEAGSAVTVMGRAEEMNCMMSPVVLSMVMAMGVPSACAEPPTVRTAAEAIAVAKRLCAHLISSHQIASRPIGLRFWVMAMKSVGIPLAASGASMLDMTILVETQCR